MAAERACARHPMERADEMPGDRMQPRAISEFALDVGHDSLEYILHGWVRRRFAEHQGIDRQQSPRLLIGRTSEHDTVDTPKVLLGFLKAGDAAIDDDRRIGQRVLEPIDPVIVERRDVAIFLWRQSIEPGFSGVHDQRIGAGRDHAAGQRIQC
jgi:hypothetical protein